ncbi:hypothetical protein NDI45_05260 [Leptolyngbya sp. GB1-A1]|uniref:hypothetical protein n=1 Tax=Leptolyngbya sp. GB1-A1 TaxID=2933908 RepID=UPI0032982EC3
MADPIDNLLKQVQQGETARSSSPANSLSPIESSAVKSIDYLLAEFEATTSTPVQTVPHGKF